MKASQIVAALIFIPCTPMDAIAGEDQAPAPVHREAGEPSPASPLGAEIKALILADAKKLERPPEKKPEKPAAQPSDVVRMDPYIVRNHVELPKFLPPTGSALYQMLKTGTILEHIGRTFTSQAYVTGAPVLGPGGESTGFTRMEVAFRLSW